MELIMEKAPGKRHMERDIALFNKCENGSNKTILCVYQWNPPCISLGYSQKIEDEIDAEKASKLGWEVVKRPTGGGIVFHNEAEVTYSLITSIDSLPEGLIPSFMKISGVIVEALGGIGIDSEIRNPKSEIRNKSQFSKFEFNKFDIISNFDIRHSNLCFSYPASYEIVSNGKKIVGSAQKRGKHSLLQQGSIFVSRIPDELLSVLRKEHEKINAISIEEILGRLPTFEELSVMLIKSFRKLYDE